MFSRARLKVASAIFSDFVVFWLGNILINRNILVLTGDIALAIFSYYLAVKIEELLENNND